MHRPEPLRRVAHALLGLLAAAVLGGCVIADQLRESRDEPQAEVYGLITHLDVLNQLLEAPDDEQRRLIEALELAWTYAPSTSSQVRLALALSTPGHPHYAPARARGMLDDLLAADDPLLEGEERMLRLRRAELERHRHNEQVAELAELEAAHETAHRLNEVSVELEQALRRAQSLETRNQELSEALREAESKLEAITTIERTIRERDENNGQDEP